MACPYAFLTLVSSDHYLPGALAQVAALRDVHPSPPQPPELPFNTVCLVTPESLDVSTLKALRKAFDLVVGVEILEQNNPAALKLLGRPDLTTVLTKLHVFRLTQFQKIIFLDADVLPIRPMSHLFSISHEFSAAPDVGWPDIFNSGVLVLTPGEDKFEQLNQLVASKPSWDGGDQGLLNEWRDGDWNRLSFTYNTTPTAAYTYAPAYERYGSQIKAIHFIGPNKPWKDIPYRTPGRQPVPSDSVQTAYDYDSLVNRWFDVYDRHYSAPPVPQSPFEIKRYTPAWELPTEPSNHLPTLGLDELKRLAIQGFNASQEHVHPGEGSYTSMPLQGRVDLMRPRKPDSPKQKHQQITDVKHITDHRPLEVYIQDTDDSDHFPIDNFKYDEALSTPIARRAVLDVVDEPRWTTLPTPGPNELPSSPRLRMISLPTTPSLFAPLPTTAPDFYASESEADNNNQSFLLARSDSAHEDRPENKPHQPHHQLHHHHHHSHAHAHEQQQQPQQPQSSSPQQHERHATPPQHEERETPKRPASPPMMPWNPAIEPPPNIQPPSNAFPSDTYFENVWDHTPSRKNDQTQPGPSPPDSGGFFQPPPPPVIPDTLIKQGHYRNVTGDSPEGSHPSPDKKKVKTVFPWEEHPRAPPKRVFPDADAPPPSLFLSPGSQSQTESTTMTTPSTPETTVPTRATHGGGGGAAPVSQLSPLYGLPTSFSYTNAWDSIPSIQKYASRLVKPTFPSYMQPLPLPLAPAFEDDAYRKNRKKSWDERAEVSSRDGDDEDNADDDDDKEAVVSTGRKLDENDSDGESAKKRRSRRGSVVTANSLLGINKKQYKTRGVQTTVVEKRSMGVQVNVEVPAPKPKVMEAPASGSGSGSGTTRHVKRASASSRRHWAPATASTVVAPVMSTSSTSTTDLGSGLPVDTLPDHHHHHRHHQQQQHSQQQQHVAKKKSPSVSPTFSPMRPPREFVVAPPPPPPSQNIAKSAVAAPTPPPLPLPPAKPSRSGTSSPSLARSGGTGTGGSAQTKLAAVQMVRSASVPQTGNSARSVGYPPSAPARLVIAAAAPAPAPAPAPAVAPAPALSSGVPPPLPTPPLQPGVTLRPTIRTSNSSTSTIVPAPGVGGGGIRSAPASAVVGPSLRRGGGIGGGEEGSSASRNSPSSIARRTSNDSSLGSPASSFGPMSPPPSVGGDVHGFGSHHHHHHHHGGQWANGGSGHGGRGHGAPGALLSPTRKGTRVWDPARGVDLFKKGSEEVLARFLKMGAWEEEAR